jgi:hypothetical protein
MTLNATPTTPTTLTKLALTASAFHADLRLLPNETLTTTLKILHTLGLALPHQPGTATRTNPSPGHQSRRVRAPNILTRVLISQNGPKNLKHQLKTRFVLAMIPISGMAAVMLKGR